MFRTIFGAALLSSAALIAAPAVAGPGGGHGGMGMPGGGMAMPGGGMGMRPMAAPSQMMMNSPMTHSTTSMRMNSHAMARAATRLNGHATAHASTRLNSRTALRAGSHSNLGLHASKSQGLMHASLTAIEHASPHSVLARNAVSVSALPGLTTGLTVKGSGGATVGTVTHVVTGSDGSIRLVVATSPTGHTIRLAPNTLTVSGGVVTTTMI